ncbi:MAG: ferrochelatase [Gammaproteobacteria bacterium]|nr:ferrochelatase [Gammaproteobacteria bacterium]
MNQLPAVVLLNLGGPDSLAAVQPFLYNLFSDPDIFKLPFGRLTQKTFAALISRLRQKEAAKGYAAIGGKSPLLEHTQAQARALQQALANSAEVYVCMRYWHPLTAAVVTRLKQRGHTRVILLPLYPQYSNTTTGSAHNEFARECERQHYQPDVRLISHWHDHPAYLQAIVDSLRVELKRFPDPDSQQVELLLSAHGLPRKLVDAGDPYEAQINATADAVRTRLGWPHITLCYQSRVGPLEWLKPYTEEVIRTKARAGTKQMLVYPIAFVSDHIETLYELGMTYAVLAQANGITHYRVVPALNAHPLLIAALKDQVMNALH